MTGTEIRFLEAATKVESIKEELEKAYEELNTTMNELKVGTYVQDPGTLLVYKVVKPKGTFTYYRDIDYVRTKKEDEKTGTLSVKEAESMGFKVK